MSGECYTTKNFFKSIDSSKKEHIIEEMKLDEPTNSEKINQLLEYESMVSSAENKCTQLKGQLDLIKQFYNHQSEVAKSVPVTKKEKFNTKYMHTKMDSHIETVKGQNSNPKVTPTKMIRQNSRCIETDTTGGALGTINNILAGITKSIQVSDVIDQRPKPNRDSNKEEKYFRQGPIHGVEEVKINTRSKQSIWDKKSRTKLKQKSNKLNISQSSSTIFKKSKKSTTKLFEKRNKNIESQVSKKPGIPTINRNSRRIVGKSKYLPRYYSTKKLSPGQDLVEIYHNSAVKECKSSESDVPKKKDTPKEDVNVIEIVPPLDIEDHTDEKREEFKEGISEASRNYTMPTIASRLKQVAKYYMNSFNLKTIPFCPTSSTSASHNIGINIQQVMSMIKTKQPTSQLSPTLAYNIALAAGKWQKKPLSTLANTATSRTIYSNCPLTKSTINYQQLQEIAKTIPQETIEEGDENEENNDSPETQSIIITGPSGDVKVTNPRQTIWTANKDDKKCTCVPHKGTEIQRIINKFNGNTPSCKVNKTSTVTSKPKDVKTPSEKLTEDTVTEYTPLQNKEKKLKEVLSKLHDEFERMTVRYDELIKKNEQNNDSPELNKEIEDLDKELNSKEEEIVMVMALYKEVLALKKQVKALKERTISKENVGSKTSCSIKTDEHNVVTAGHLNKLLSRIQHFQACYKR